MNAKNDKNKRLPHLLSIAGLALIIVSCGANIYGASANLRFIHEPIDVVYYFRYIVLLGGGFAAGYFITKQADRFNKFFGGTTYALLTMTFFWLLDCVRIGFESAFGALAYPFGKIVFMGTPLLVAMIILSYAYVIQRRKKIPGVHPFTKMTLIVSFLIYQIGFLLAEVYYLVITPVSYDAATPWALAANLAISPLIVSAVAYAAFNKERRSDRLFYASFIGVIYTLATLALWELQTDPSHEATNTFAIAVTFVSLLYIGCILWCATKAAKR